MKNMPTHYATLKIARDAPAPVIRASYRALMQMYHPDNFQGHETEAAAIASTIREAYEILIDEKSREAYDQWIDAQLARVPYFLFDGKYAATCESLES